MDGSDIFPRELTSLERELLLWILPDHRPGYNAYRRLLDDWMVIARGRRGEGNFILGTADEPADNESPLPQVLAYGMVETRNAKISVSVRERMGEQVEFEIENLQGEGIPAVFEETRRWTYSTWLPGQACSICLNALREVPMQTKNHRTFVLALCGADQRLWVYDGESGINHPIPITNFYNELMLHRNIRDPKVALDSKRLFRELPNLTDADLQSAFASYNKIRTKVNTMSEIIVQPEPKKSAVRRFLETLHWN